MQEYLRESRLSRYRGIFADPPRREALYGGLLNHTKKLNHNKPIIRVSRYFIATTGRGPDGSFSVLPIDKPGDISSSDPLIKGHTDTINDLAFNPFHDQIISSASKDKAIHIWKVSRKGLTSDVTDPRMVLQGHTGAVNAIKFHPTTDHLLASVSSDNTVRLWDVEKGLSIYSADHLNGIDMLWNDIGSEYLLRSFTSDVDMCDARTGGTIRSLPDTVGNFVMMPGLSDHVLTLDWKNNIVKVWDIRNTSCSSEIKSLTLEESVSGDIDPVYDADVKLLFLIDKSNKYVSIYDCSGRKAPLEKLFTYKSKLTARSIALVPKRATNIAGCEIARVLKLTNETIEPLSFSVPRIHDSFQEDLYPDTFSGEPSQTKEQWLNENANNPPKLMSLLDDYKESERRNISIFEPDTANRGPMSVTNGPANYDSDDEVVENAIPMKVLQGTPFLKFGRRGSAQEKLLRLKDRRYITWESSWFSFKFGKTCSVDLEKALRIQRGQMTTKFDRESKYYGAAKDTAFSVIYIERREEKSVDFIAQSKELCDLWFNTIERIIKDIRITRESTALTTRFLKFTFELADADKNDILSLQEVNNLLDELSINSQQADVIRVFNEVSNSEANLKFDQFRNFIFKLRRRYDLEFLWSRLIENKMVHEVLPLQIKDSVNTEFIHEKSRLSLESFTKFWRKSTTQLITDVKNEKNVEEEAERILISFMGDAYQKDDPYLSYEGFFKLMNSETNDAYDPDKRALYQDMNHPLSYYYMYSSHNTYLEADQVVGKCSVNRYINDLIRGVRCVELDTWDGAEGDPMITHGGTLVNRIKFIDVIKAIKTFAFVSSSYPVVLSIENHCTMQQQRRMALMMRGIFGDALLDSSAGYYASAEVDLLSPDELKEKILIKGMRPKNEDVLAAVEEEHVEDEEEMEYDDEDDQTENRTNKVDDDTKSGSGSSWRPTSENDPNSIDGNAAVSIDFGDSSDSASVASKSGSSVTANRERKKAPLKKVDSKLSAGDTSSVSESTAGSTNTDSASRITLSSMGGRMMAKPKPHQFLSDVTYFATYKYNKKKGFESDAPADHICSFSEDKMEKLARKHMKQWIDHNKTHLSRVYPRASRIDSSNYDPIRAWRVGAQVVALNTQTHDTPNILNDGMFRQNGGCGYVLKPNFLLFKDAKRAPSCRIRVNVISGQSFPKVKGATGIPSPKVEISINGEDEHHKFETSTVQNNGFDPVWDEVFDFTVEHPDLVQLTFEVKTDANFLSPTQKDIASGSIPLSCLRSGFRIVRLYDENGRNDFEFAFATLFIHVSVEDTQFYINV